MKAVLISTLVKNTQWTTHATEVLLHAASTGLITFEKDQLLFIQMPRRIFFFFSTEQMLARKLGRNSYQIFVLS